MKTKTITSLPEFYVEFQTPLGRRNADPIRAADKAQAAKLFVESYGKCKVLAVFTPVEFAERIRAAVARRTA